MQPLLVVDSLAKIYRSGRGRRNVAVSGVSFEIASGRTLGLVGESGSGKSTIARCILQLESADQGSIRFRGVDLSSLSGKALRQARRGMQAVFQDPMASIDPRWTVEQALEEPLRAIGEDRQVWQNLIDDALSRVGLDGHEKRRPHELSGGQAQRVAIARAIVARPDLIICDEATSALDVSIQAQILGLLRQLRNDLDLSMLFISHDLGVVRYICDDLLVMNSGSIVERGPIDEVLHRPKADYTARLIEAATLDGVGRNDSS